MWLSLGLGAWACMLMNPHFFSQAGFRKLELGLNVSWISMSVLGLNNAMEIDYQNLTWYSMIIV